jgi:hypothetical protein
MNGLEVKLDEWLVKKAPFQMPENARKGLVTALPWLTLIGGVLMLWAAWGLYQLLTYVSPFVGLANELNAAYGVAVAPSVVNYGPVVWLSLALLAVEAVMFFIAFPALQAHKKSGWNLLFWVSLINIVEVVLQMIGYTNFGSLVLALLGSLVGLYLLFQVRSYYTPAGSAVAHAGGPSDTMKTPKETPPADKPADAPAEKHDDHQV